MKVGEKNDCLILAPRGDLSARAVDWALQATGCTPIWAESLADPTLGSTSVTVSDAAPLGLLGALGARCRSVFNWRPREPDQFPHAHPDDQQFLRDEWLMFQRNVFALADLATPSLWVNRPEAAARAECKLVQLGAARECGIRIPDTLVSNDPTKIREFVAAHEKVIYKAFIPHSWSEPGRQFAIFVRVLDKAMLREDDSLSACPGIYQAFVPKTCDIRITVIGEQLFALKLSAPSGGAHVDWREHANGANGGVVVERFEVPRAYEARLRALMQRLGIVYGCFDVVLDANGEPFFLEVNQGGQSLWVERLMPEFPVLRALTAMLASGSTRYALDAVAQEISYAAFIESEVSGQNLAPDQVAA